MKNRQSDPNERKSFNSFMEETSKELSLNSKKDDNNHDEYIEGLDMYMTGYYGGYLSNLQKDDEDKSK